MRNPASRVSLAITVGRAVILLVALAFAIAMLSGCAVAPAYNVRAPVCEPPPLPASVLQPCEEPEAPLARGDLAELYLTAIADTGPWGRCIRAHDKLVELVKYRDAMCAKFLKDNAPPPEQPGWRWPWQR